MYICINTYTHTYINIHISPYIHTPTYMLSELKEIANHSIYQQITFLIKGSEDKW